MAIGRQREIILKTDERDNALGAAGCPGQAGSPRRSSTAGPDSSSTTGVRGLSPGHLRPVAAPPTRFRPEGNRFCGTWMTHAGRRSGKDFGKV